LSLSQSLPHSSGIGLALSPGVVDRLAIVNFW
jgi:hypothetical protein